MPHSTLIKYYLLFVCLLTKPYSLKVDLDQVDMLPYFGNIFRLKIIFNKSKFTIACYKTKQKSDLGVF